MRDKLILNIGCSASYNGLKSIACIPKVEICIVALPDMLDQERIAAYSEKQSGTTFF
jgi:hypothetical protein